MVTVSCCSHLWSGFPSLFEFFSHRKRWGQTPPGLWGSIELTIDMTRGKSNYAQPFFLVGILQCSRQN